MDMFILEPHHVALLSAAASALDRAEEARELITSEGAYIHDRFKQRRAHPAVAVERDSRTLFARLVRELGFDVDAPLPPGRPPSSGS